MNDTEAFLRKIRENPDDDAPRLVFADYLDEQAQCSSGKEAKEQAQWAAFIRAGVAKKRETVADISYWSKCKGIDFSSDCRLAKELIPEQIRVWQFPHMTSARWTASCGFYDELEIRFRELVEVRDAIFDSLFPIRKLFVYHFLNEWASISGHPVLSLIRELETSVDDRWTKDKLEVLCNDPQLRGLSSLNIEYAEIEDIVAVLKDNENFPNLRRLVVPVDDLNNFAKLLEYPVAAKLESISSQYASSEVSVRCTQLLSTAPLVKTLRTLVIDDSFGKTPKRGKWGAFQNLQKLKLSVDKSEDWIDRFLESQNWQTLKQLDIQGKHLPPNVLDYFEMVEDELMLNLVDLNREQLEGILSSEVMSKVKGVQIRGRHINLAIEVLSQNDAAVNLRSLEFVAEDGIKKPVAFYQTLSTSPVFANLLNLRTTESIPLSGLKYLEDSPIGQSLRCLVCDTPQDIDKSLEILRSSKRIPNLVHFGLSVPYTDRLFEKNLIAKGRKYLKL